MAPTSILEEIKNFLENDNYTTLELTFETLEISLFHHGKRLNQLVRQDAELILQKTNDPTIAEMDVVDNLVFPFLFTFNPQEALAGQTTQMQKLPRPLNHGSLCIKHYCLELEFTIESPSKEMELRVMHLYLGSYLIN